MATLRKCEGGWKEVDFEMLGVTTTLRVVTKFIVGFFALAGGPVILAIWFGLNWASGIPSGLRFRKSR
ncbi:MAG: hypothetical protein U1A25_01980 [Candidatus Sungbacteria bacterium]|nr:hypothetical protein [Candidatus Sungbacteria bacterium]